MPTPTFMQNDAWKRAQDLAFSQRVQDDISRLTFPQTVRDGIDQITKLGQPFMQPAVQTKPLEIEPMQAPDPLPIVVSDRPEISLPNPAPTTPSASGQAVTTASAPSVPGVGATTPPAGVAPTQDLRQAQQWAYQLARQNGMDDEAARIIAAITTTEGGYGGAIGDQGQAHGILQFHEGGELQGFGQWLQRQGIQGDPRQHAQNAELAIRYASEGYLGAAIAEGRRLGLTGSRLATYVQQHGQRSVRPETTGANYDALPGDLSAPAQQQQAAPQPPVQQQAPTGAPQGVADGPNWRQTWGDNLTPNQIDETLALGMDWESAIATCGVAAAIAFARANGRNPTFKEALELARSTGEWNANVGMTRGSTGQVALLNRLGVDAHVRPVSEQGLIAEIQAGRPVQINAHGNGGHFYVASAVRQGPNGLEFYFGNSASILKRANGRQWFTLAELPSLGVGTPSEMIVLGRAQ